MHERILIVDADEALRDSLELLLASEGYVLVSTASGAEALTRIESLSVDLVLCDSRMPGLDGFDLLPQIARRLPGTPIILVSSDDPESLAAEALKRGAHGCLSKPVRTSELLLSLRLAWERDHLRRRNALLERDLERAAGARPIVAASRAMIQLLERLERTTEYKTTTLLTGEVGAGKESLARVIHAQSPRRHGPFVHLCCASTPSEQLESALFGRESATRGANAAESRGRLLDADGGTLFLDEVCALPPGLQTRLTEVIEREQVQIPGTSKARDLDLRVIASTTRDLEEEMQAGGLDADLYYRLDVARLEVPPLRERREDIPLLLDHFLAHARATVGKDVHRFADDALECLTTYRWPGNIRELENLVERAVILADTDRITLHELPEAVSNAEHVAGESTTEDYSLKRARHSAEAMMIGRALRATGGNRTHAAKLLGISHRALLYKIKDFGVRD